MKNVPFYPNAADNNQCMVSVYRSILEYFLKKPFTQKAVRDFVGYERRRAAWSLAPLTKMVDMGFDIRMIEPFDYRAYATKGTDYLEEFFSKDELAWLLKHSNILDIQPFIPQFLKTVRWENRRGTLTDIDTMLHDGRLVVVTLNLATLNGKEGTVSHAILIIGSDPGGYIIHDPGLPPAPYRHVSRQKLWEAIGGNSHTNEVTGFKLKNHLSERLDQYVTSQIPGISRAFAAKLIEDHKVSSNGRTIDKPGYKLRKDDAIHIDYNPAELARIPSLDLPVLYEDDDCVVIDKPAGILTHSKGAYNPEATVATWLRSRLTNGLAGERAGIVHRLDRATSGVMICAKTPAALTWLQKQFSTRKVQKTYYAVVPGHMPHQHALIDIPMARNPKKPQTFHASSTGKPALTEYWVRAQSDAYSLLELRPQTGRTHQLRVHVSHLGHPILGDSLYGGHPADRLFLHAEQLELTLPNRTRRTFHSPLPKEFRAMVQS